MLSTPTSLAFYSQKHSDVVLSYQCPPVYPATPTSTRKVSNPGSTPSASLHVNIGSAQHTPRGHATHLHLLLTVHLPKLAIMLAKLSTAPSQTCSSTILGTFGASSLPGPNANPQPAPLPLKHLLSTVPPYLTLKPLLSVRLRPPLP